MSATPQATPAGSSPTTSNTNVDAGRIKASLAIVPVGADGKIHLYNHSGSVDLVVDILGYLETGYDATSRVGRIVPLEAPFRAFDTRVAEFGRHAVRQRQREDWSFKSFVDSVTLSGNAVGTQTALIGNLTAADLQQAPATSSCRCIPPMFRPSGRPDVEHQRVHGQSVPNMSLLKYGSTSSDDPYVVTAFNTTAPCTICSTCTPSCSTRREFRLEPPVTTDHILLPVRSADRLSDRITGLIRSAPEGPGPVRTS